jgi:glycosyltransferase involved in cell wall biosynthesis
MMQLLFIIILFAGLSVVVFSVIGSIVYDLSLEKINKTAADHPYSRALRKRPFVSVILFEQNDINSLKRSLQSVLKNNYRKFEVIVVSEKDIEQVKSEISGFRKKYKSKNIKIVKSANYNSSVLKNNSEIVLELKNIYMLDKDAIKETVNYFALNKDSTSLVPHVNGVFSYSVSSLLLQNEYILKNNFKKSQSALLRINKDNNGILAYLNNANAPTNTSYCTNIKAHTNKPAVSLNHDKNLLNTSLLAGSFILLSYLVYLAFVAHYSALLALAWVGFSFFIALNIWAEDDLTIANKLILVLLAPMISLLMYLALPVKLFKLVSSQAVRQYPRVKFVG